MGISFRMFELALCPSPHTRFSSPALAHVVHHSISREDLAHAARLSNRGTLPHSLKLENTHRCILLCKQCDWLLYRKNPFQFISRQQDACGHTNANAESQFCTWHATQFDCCYSTPVNWQVWSQQFRRIGTYSHFFLNKVGQLKFSHSTWPKPCFARADRDISKTWTQRMWSKVLCPSPSKNLRQLWHFCSLAYLSGDRTQTAVWKQVLKHKHAQERARKKNRTETMQTGNSDTDRWEQLQEKMVHVCERLRKEPTWNQMGPLSTCIQKRSCAISYMDRVWSQF